ncbi:hypothetical protein Terro_0214 [Terriglobus roseus DSM 18391]|uniref:Lipoprotein n=1 Tax=Terriglobus roseus (strain DSM 18391 / NRRL B-41598 / KBS 63) TaxID=926566 RepID=I3ZBE6_TERRK|nr:hypothetical protein [Terriglobus roseus]AFL86564.1 hypothetical protein Terro_0214 [Terriglobus roseus DSM 18391]
MRRNLQLCVALAATSLMVTTGCKGPKDESSNLKSAINSYYDQWPDCLWRNPIQMPQQHDKDDASKVMPFDALVDQGLLSRTPVEKTKLLVLKKEANSYDLTDKGRSNWTADVNQPGYGNFCYAHRKVKDIVSNTPAGTQPGATTTVNYTYTLGDVKDWAQATETQNAFPQLRTALTATNNAKATLTLTNDGWKMQPVAKSAGGDSGIVE